MENWWLWLVGIVLLALVVLVAVRRNYDVDISSGDHKLSLKRPAVQDAGRGVEVLKSAELEDVEIDAITGAKLGSGAETDLETVDVLGKAKIKKTKLGNITGLEIGADPDRNR